MKELQVAEAVAELLISAISESGAPGPESHPLQVTGTGVLADTARWANAHADAADGMFKSLMGAVDPLSGLPGMLVLGLSDLIAAHTRAASEGTDAILDTRPARKTTSPSGLILALVTPVTDGRQLLRELMGRVPGRPLYIPDSPTIPTHLGNNGDPVQFGESFGLTDREVDELWRRRPDPQVVRRATERIFKSLEEHDPVMSPAYRALLAADPNAAVSLPIVRQLLGVMRGVKRGSLRLPYVQVMDFGPYGSIALVIWDPRRRISRRLRAQMAGHLRYVCDRRIAPWLRWPDWRRRREALQIYVGRMVDGRPGADRCASILRARHPADYADEPPARTIRRLYRLSDHLREAAIPVALRRAARESVRASAGPKGVDAGEGAG